MKSLIRSIIVHFKINEMQKLNSFREQNVEEVFIWLETKLKLSHGRPLKRNLFLVLNYLDFKN